MGLDLRRVDLSYDGDTDNDMTELEICSADGTHADGISAVILESLRTTNAKDALARRAS
jgi:hypothetical protein